MENRITDQDVFEYREIYYEHVKPIFKAWGVLGMKISELAPLLSPILEKYGWSFEKYQAFGSIDFAQRLSRMKSESFVKTGTEPSMKVIAGDVELDSISMSRIPELRCPIRSEQKFDT